MFLAWLFPFFNPFTLLAHFENMREQCDRAFFLHVQFYNVGKPRTWAPRTHHVDHAFQNSMRVFVLPLGLISFIVLPHKTLVRCRRKGSGSGNNRTQNSLG